MTDYTDHEFSMELSHDQRASADDTHGYVVRGVPSGDEDGPRSEEPSVAASTATAEPLLSTAESDGIETSFRPLPLRATTRRKISKTLQLALLRKYVQSAKEVDGIPDRTTTEHLLDQAYDEFYFHGGDVNEQRMGYAAFVKLVRNRRCEFTRLNRLGRDQPSHHKKHAKEQEEIHVLVGELERVRRDERQRRAGHEPNVVEDRDTSHDSGTNSQTETPRATTIPPASAVVNGEELVLIPKRQLELILQSAQETLETQAKLLAQVATLERQLGEMQQQRPSY